VTEARSIEQTYLPDHLEDLARFHEFLAAHVAPHLIAGPGAPDHVELPAELRRVLVQVVEALLAGKAVTIAPRSLTLTTQQAADLLNVSRPTVVKLVDDGEIPCERPGHRRQLHLTDVLEYRQRRRQQQYAGLIAAEVPVDEDDPEAVRAALKEARRVVAEKRRARSKAV